MSGQYSMGVSIRTGELPLSQISIDCLGRASDVWCVVPPVCVRLHFRALRAELLCALAHMDMDMDMDMDMRAQRKCQVKGGNFHGVRRQI